MGVDGFQARPYLRLRDRFVVFSFLRKGNMARVGETLTYAEVCDNRGFPHVAPEGGPDSAW